MNGADQFPYGQQKPWESYQERIVSEALAESQAPEQVLRGLPTPLEFIMAFPDRFGYPTAAERQPTIDQVLSTAGLYPDAANKVSGDEGLYSGSSRNAMSTEPLG